LSRDFLNFKKRTHKFLFTTTTSCQETIRKQKRTQCRPRISVRVASIFSNSGTAALGAAA
jgi:hypothetical protein